MPIKFQILNSSTCWYGWPIQLEHELVKMGLEVSKKGISICYLVDTGPRDPDFGMEATQANWDGLETAIHIIENNKFDLIFYSTKWFGEKYLSGKNNAFYLPFGCDTKIFNSNSIKLRNKKVGFVGSMDNNHIMRRKFIEYFNDIEEFKIIFPPEPIYFKDLAKFYNNCLIVPNQARFGEINYRVFEAAACGACVVQERVHGIEKLFEENEEIILWDTLAEMKEKIVNLLKNPELAQKIGVKGMKRVYSNHSLSKRAEFIVEKLINNT